MALFAIEEGEEEEEEDEGITEFEIASLLTYKITKEKKQASLSMIDRCWWCVIDKRLDEDNWWINDGWSCGGRIEREWRKEIVEWNS